MSRNTTKQSDECKITCENPFFFSCKENKSQTEKWEDTRHLSIPIGVCIDRKQTLSTSETLRGFILYYTRSRHFHPRELYKMTVENGFMLRPERKAQIRTDKIRLFVPEFFLTDVYVFLSDVTVALERCKNTVQNALYFVPFLKTPTYKNLKHSKNVFVKVETQMQYNFLLLCYRNDILQR